MVPKIFVLILNYQGRDTLADCIRSVLQSDCQNLEIVVVDNASKDGSFEYARANFPRLHFIGSTQNRGFAAGNNLGIRFAVEKGADYVFLLNNDAFVERNTLAIMLKEAKKQATPSVMSPVIMKGNKDSSQVWFCGGAIDWKHMRCVHMNPQMKPGGDAVYDTQYVTGCAMLIPKEIIRSVGLLDEKYFLYYEDADYCVRAKKAGFGIKVCPSAHVYHLEKSEVNNPRKLYWLVISGILFFRTHTAGMHRWRTERYLFLRKGKNCIDLLLNRSRENARMVRKAYSDVHKAKHFHHYREFSQR